MEMNSEVIINKLEYKINELTFRNKDLEKLGAINDRLDEEYRCDLIKELLSLSLNEQNISITDGIARGNRKIAQLRLNRDLAKIRYYSMKSSIENIKIEIQVLRGILTWLRDEF